MNAVRTAALLALTLASAAAGPWAPTTWQNEAAFAARSDNGAWVAIVSVERGRLVHLGATVEPADNLILATPQRDDPLGWSGHRVWLGPQRTWPHGWPPPAAWEQSAATPTLADADRRLTLTPPPTGEAGWPDLERVYQWSGGRLQCTATARGETARDVQIVQIIQVPADAEVEITVAPTGHALQGVADRLVGGGGEGVTVAPTVDAPQGYVQLPSYFRPEFRRQFNPPPHLAVNDGGRLVFRFVPNQPEKFGFRAGPLIARRGATTLTLSADGADVPNAVGEPDEGYNVQLFFGGRERFIELEILTPLQAENALTLRSSTVFLTPRYDP